MVLITDKPTQVVVRLLYVCTVCLYETSTDTGNHPSVHSRSKKIEFTDSRKFVLHQLTKTEKGVELRPSNSE